MFQINQIDLAPNFAGPILSIGNMLGSLTALGVPVLVSYIVTDVVRHILILYINYCHDSYLYNLLHLSYYVIYEWS